MTPRYVVNFATGRAWDDKDSDLSGTHLSVRLSEGECLSGEVLKTDRDADLAIIKIAPTRNVSNPEILESSAGVGDRVVALLGGRYGERRIEVGSVVVLAEEGQFGEGRVIMSAGHVTEKSFGLPVVDSKGDLVGLIYAVERERGLTLYFWSQLRM